MGKALNVLVLMQVNDDERKIIESCAPSSTFVYCKPNEIDKQQLAAADVILGNPPVGDAKNAEALRFLQLQTAGSDAYAAKGVLPEGALLANATGTYGLAIAEHMVGVLMALNENLHTYRDQQRESIWKNRMDRRLVLGSTIMVIGLGDIGTEFAKRAKALGAKVIGVRRAGLDKPDCVDELYLSDKIDELLPEADTVALCLPQTADTQNLINRESIAKMKPGAVIINIGRGSAVDEDALCDALDSGHLWGAALDVTNPEPPTADSRLWQTEKLLLTPHISGGGQLPETRGRLIKLMADNLAAFVNGEPIKNIVDAKTGYRKL